jgi:predicted membrane protein
MDRDRPFLTPRLIVGVIIVLIGVVFLLEEFAGIDADDYLVYWPLGLIAIGLVAFFQGGNRIGATLALVVGVWALAYNLGYISIEIWQFWPLALVAIGLSLVRRALGGAPAADKAPSGDPLDRVNGFAIMGGVTRKSNSQTFRGGELTAIMGGCELDLREAHLAEGEVIIDVFALWGGVEIRVPESWGIVGKVQPVMGAFEDNTRPPRDSKTRLTVRGAAIMGGVEVKN